jgi:hypothetical protein
MSSVFALGQKGAICLPNHNPWKQHSSPESAFAGMEWKKASSALLCQPFVGDFIDSLTDLSAP